MIPFPREGSLRVVIKKLKAEDLGRRLMEIRYPKTPPTYTKLITKDTYKKFDTMGVVEWCVNFLEFAKCWTCDALYGISANDDNTTEIVLYFHHYPSGEESPATYSFQGSQISMQPLILEHPLSSIIPEPVEPSEPSHSSESPPSSEPSQQQHDFHHSECAQLSNQSNFPQHTECSQSSHRSDSPQCSNHSQQTKKCSDSPDDSLLSQLLTSGQLSFALDHSHLSQDLNQSQNSDSLLTKCESPHLESPRHSHHLEHSQALQHSHHLQHSQSPQHSHHLGHSSFPLRSLHLEHSHLPRHSEDEPQPHLFHHLDTPLHPHYFKHLHHFHHIKH